MKIETEYDIGEQVVVKELKVSGVVLTILMTTRSMTQYEVRYLFNGEYHNTYLFNFEIEKAKSAAKKET